MASARDVLQNMMMGKELLGGSPVVIGTAQQADEQMEALDTFADTHPSEVVGKDGTVLSPNLLKLIQRLPRTPSIYETKFNLDSIVRFDTSFTAADVTATLPFPNPIPQGKYAFLDEVSIAQLSGTASTPSGYLTDQQVSQLFGIVVPDGSTFGAAYKSGRSIIPGGILPLLTFNSLFATGTYLVGVQYKLRTRIDIPYVDLSSMSQNKDDYLSFDDANEVGTENIGQQEYPGGPYDDAGYDTQ